MDLMRQLIFASSACTTYVSEPQQKCANNTTEWLGPIAIFTCTFLFVQICTYASATKVIATIPCIA